MFEKIKRRFPWFAPLSLFDWGLSLVLGLAALAINATIDPFRGYLPDSSDNPTVDYPYVPDTIPMWLAFVLSYVFPVLCFILMQIAFKLALKKWDIAHDLYNALLGLVEAAVVNVLVVESIKPFAGRYRPYYLSVRDDPAREAEARQSFPSGHTATAFSGLGYLSMYFAGKLRLLSGRGGALYRGVAVVAPLYVALIIAVTRTRDMHHNYSDIIAGGIIGMACALFGYFMNFPPLSHERCHFPINRNDPSATSTAGPAAVAPSDSAEKPLEPV